MLCCAVSRSSCHRGTALHACSQSEARFGSDCHLAFTHSACGIAARLSIRTNLHGLIDSAVHLAIIWNISYLLGSISGDDIEKFQHIDHQCSSSAVSLQVGDANGNCPTYRSTAPPQTKYRGGTAAPQVPPGQQTTLPPHPSQPTFAYGLLPTEGSTNSSLLAPNGGDGGGHLTSHNSGDIFGALDTTSTRCDRPRPSSQLELRQYSSTNELPPAAQNHNMRWRSRTSKGAAGGAAAGCGSPPSAGGAARSARGLAAGAGSSPRWGLHRHSTEGASPPRVVSGDLEGTESVWSSECPDQGNRMLHISGRPDDKASGWPYNTRRW